MRDGRKAFAGRRYFRIARVRRRWEPPSNREFWEALVGISAGNCGPVTGQPVLFANTAGTEAALPDRQQDVFDSRGTVVEVDECQ